MRFWEIDFLRGCAVITMVIYHLLYNLYAFGSLNINLYQGFWHYFQVATASTFLALAGVSLTLSYNRTLQQGKQPRFTKYLKRGLRILGWGMVITVFTYFTLGDWYVRFGVLHCIGVSTILGYFFLALPNDIFTLVVSLLCLAVGHILSSHTFPFSFLLFLGFMPHHFHTIDYFPLFPWWGVVLLGIFLGKQLYPGYRRAFSLPDWSQVLPVQVVSFLGRHSLTIYLLHQPIIIVVLYLLGLIRLPV